MELQKVQRTTLTMKEAAKYLGISGVKIDFGHESVEML